MVESWNIQWIRYSLEVDVDELWMLCCACVYFSNVQTFFICSNTIEHVDWKNAVCTQLLAPHSLAHRALPETHCRDILLYSLCAPCSYSLMPMLIYRFDSPWRISHSHPFTSPPSTTHIDVRRTAHYRSLPNVEASIGKLDVEHNDWQIQFDL